MIKQDNFREAVFRYQKSKHNEISDSLYEELDQRYVVFH
jgi:hypothetical protein